MLQLNKKKADSMIVSYVLLISITIAIAGIAYAWLRFKSDISEPESCPEGVSVYISDYFFNERSKELNLTIINRGRFNIKGFFVRINNNTDFDSGVYNLGKFDITLKPDQEIKLVFNQTNYKVNMSAYGKVCFIEIQPFVTSSKTEMILCPYLSTKKVPC
ncbi:MAG: hypothetical protein QXX68_00340 [Candidatus Pacearchaeota archaeon]